MTHTDFVAWLRGIDAVLKGAAPSPELWKQIVAEAGRISPPVSPVLPWGRNLGLEVAPASDSAGRNCP